MAEVLHLIGDYVLPKTLIHYPLTPGLCLTRLPVSALWQHPQVGSGSMTSPNHLPFISVRKRIQVGQRYLYTLTLRGRYSTLFPGWLIWFPINVYPPFSLVNRCPGQRTSTTISR
ncbi:hypothetical protein M407DRAFT_89993 [Tulasnella calospora MUT 4182]|uniref:Uncharacterized protein n=1 Tax=Tulasnella calospora MUT 4182 TaxID=1051891 RepID=A0A0C3QNI7_9AGAM|nr:hypothetical protein M407DRAFT_89993 [Tulasnella calospora MUT 4182]